MQTWITFPTQLKAALMKIYLIYNKPLSQEAIIFDLREKVKKARGRILHSPKAVASL